MDHSEHGKMQWMCIWWARFKALEMLVPLRDKSLITRRGISFLVDKHTKTRLNPKLSPVAEHAVSKNPLCLGVVHGLHLPTDSWDSIEHTKLGSTGWKSRI